MLVLDASVVTHAVVVVVVVAGAAVAVELAVVAAADVAAFLGTHCTAIGAAAAAVSAIGNVIVAAALQ